MSRIEPRILTQSQAQSGQEVAGQGRIDNVAGASRAISVKKVGRKPAREAREMPAKLRKLSGSKEILSSDLTPLRGRKRDQLAGDIARIIGKIERIEQEDPEDQLALLCKVMLREQLRRLSLIKGTQFDTGNYGEEI